MPRQCTVQAPVLMPWRIDLGAGRHDLLRIGSIDTDKEPPKCQVGSAA